MLYYVLPLLKPTWGKGEWMLHSPIFNFIHRSLPSALFVCIRFITRSVWHQHAEPVSLLLFPAASSGRSSFKNAVRLFLFWYGYGYWFSVLTGSTFITDDSNWPHRACFRLKPVILISKLPMRSVDPGRSSGPDGDVMNAGVSQNNHLLFALQLCSSRWFLFQQTFSSFNQFNHFIVNETNMSEDY